MKKCQFCVLKEAAVSYLCNQFELPEQGEFAAYKDSGVWVACKECAELIDNAPPEAVIANTLILKDYATPYLANNAIFDAAIRRVLEAFFENRIGESLPLGLDLPEEEPFMGFFGHPSQRPFDQGTDW